MPITASSSGLNELFLQLIFSHQAHKAENAASWALVRRDVVKQYPKTASMTVEDFAQSYTTQCSIMSSKYPYVNQPHEFESDNERMVLLLLMYDTIEAHRDFAFRAFGHWPNQEKRTITSSEYVRMSHAGLYPFRDGQDRMLVGLLAEVKRSKAHLNPTAWNTVQLDMVREYPQYKDLFTADFFKFIFGLYREEVNAKYPNKTKGPDINAKEEEHLMFEFIKEQDEARVLEMLAAGELPKALSHKNGGGHASSHASPEEEPTSHSSRKRKTEQPAAHRDSLQENDKRPLKRSRSGDPSYSLPDYVLYHELGQQVKRLSKSIDSVFASIKRVYGV